MPLYQYMCADCQYVFEETRKLAEYQEPLKLPCPNCKKEGTLSIQPGACGLSFRGEMRRKPTDGFNDKLKEMKKKHPGNKINVIE
jgi:putative FmdB family regulatory protein